MRRRTLIPIAAYLLGIIAGMAFSIRIPREFSTIVQTVCILGMGILGVMSVGGSDDA